MAELTRLRDLSQRVREATPVDLVKALTDAQSMNWPKLKMKDQLRLQMRGNDLVPVTNPVVARAAAILGLTPDQWFDAAGVPAATAPAPPTP